MEQNKRMVTVTVTEDNEEPVSFTTNAVFIVSNDRVYTSTACTLGGLLAFAAKIQAYFFKVIMPGVMVGTKPGVTEDVLFNHIVEFAKEVKNSCFAEVQNDSIS